MVNTLPYPGAAVAALLALLPGLKVCVVQAQEEGLVAPLINRNLSPFATGLGVPVMESATPLGNGGVTVRWDLHWASHSLREEDDTGVLELDGETRRQDLRVLLGLSENIDLVLNVPWIQHSAGSLDSLIDNWHDLWGMPEGARAEQPRDVLRFSVGGADPFSLDRSASGLGDVELGLNWRLWGDERQDLATFAQLTLDTGDAADLTGSGDTAFAVGLRYTRHGCGPAALSCHLQVGTADPGDLSLEARERSTVLYGGLSLAWQLGPEFAAVAQLEARDNAYEAGPLGASDVAVWGGLGLRWQPEGAWTLEAQFSEDLKVGSAPDISFRLSVARRW